MIKITSFIEIVLKFYRNNTAIPGIRIPVNWEMNIGEEARKSFNRWVSDGFFFKFLSGSKILDIGYKGYLENVTPILPHATGIDLDFPGYDGVTLPFPDQSQDAVFVSHALEHIDDYRTVIADWFRVIRPGGHLILIVPHQFLYERRLSLPSKHNADHRRFYTPASLLLEVEEALNPFCYRVRLLHDNDSGYDYTIPPEQHACGSYEIILVIQRIDEPGWSDRVLIPERELLREMSSGEPSIRMSGAKVVSIESLPPAIRTVLAIKLDHRGDFLLAERAFQRLRCLFPDAHLVLVVGHWNVGAAQELGFFDEIIPFSIFAENAALTDTLATDDLVSEFRELLSGRFFDLAIDLRVFDETRSILKEIDARHKAGFGTPDRFSYLDIALPYLAPTYYTPRQGIYECTKFYKHVGKHYSTHIDVPRYANISLGAPMIFGPYVTLLPGKYEFSLLIDSTEEPFLLNFDVVYQQGNVFLYEGEVLITPGVLPKFTLDLVDGVADLEIRLLANDQTAANSFRFRGCYFERLTADALERDIHQSEMMALLVAYVEERMANLYQVSEAKR